MSEIERIGIVGCGLMGAGIAEVCVRAGVDAIVSDVDDAALDRGRVRIQLSLERAAHAGKITDLAAEEAFAGIRFNVGVESFADRQVVFEAVAEHESMKIALFSELDEIVQPDSVLASNTSSIPIARLASGTRYPERVIGVHFFNPVPVMPLVEIISSLQTSLITAEVAEHFVSGVLGKTVIHARDRAGFVVNALLVPYLLGAIRMVESGFADASTVDTGMEAGCSFPLGPLRLADFIGLDTLKFIADALYEEYREPQYASPPLLSRMVDAGWLGRKSKQGFYDYLTN